jgi:hypothetical protein
MKAYPIMFKHPTTGAIIENQGMELRDWFAGMAMLGLLARDDYDYDEMFLESKTCYRIADSMIKARENKDE